MRLVLVAYEYPLLSQTFVLEQIRQLRARGHDLTVVADRPGSEPVDGVAGVEVVYSGRPRSSAEAMVRAPIAVLRLVRARKWSALLRSFDIWSYGRQAWQLRLLYTAASLSDRRCSYDAVVAHFGPNGVVASHLIDSKLLDGRLAVVFHGYDMRSEIRRASSRRAYRRLFRRRPALLPVSERLRELLVEMGADPDATQVHHMGVDVSTFRLPSGVAESSDVRLNVLSVGRLTEKKGFAIGMRALDIVAGHTPVTHTIVGDGELRPELAELAATLSNVKIELVGAKSHDEVRGLLHEVDLLLAPSVTASSGDEEGIPVVLMEAMACGLPVVSTEHAGIPELVEHGRNGLLAPEGDEEALAVQIARLSTDVDLRSRLGEAARRTVEERFDSRALARDLEEILEPRGSR